MTLLAASVDSSAQTFPGGHAQVVFITKVGTALDAPIYLPDGQGAGAQPGMVAQLFLVDGDGLSPLEPSTTFRTGPIPLAMAYIISQTVDIFQLPAGSTATLRLRVWESTKGATFEESRDNGGYYGETEFTGLLGGGVNPPTNLIGLTGFILTRQARLVFDASNPNQIAIHLDSAEPKTYRLESSSDLIHWTPFGSVTASGAAQINLPITTGLQFFRAVLQD